MRPGWDATRRNRSQGTPKRGRGQDNRMVIPCSRHATRVYYEQLRAPRIVERDLLHGPMRFYVEPPHPDSRYACTPDDVARLLRTLPVDHVRPFRAFVFRQPTRKQRRLAPVWGRLAYATELAAYGPVIFLEAQPVDLVWLHPASVDPVAERELAALRAEGHDVTRDRRGWRIRAPLTASRTTQLYRTVLHEIGHLVDREAFDARWLADGRDADLDVRHAAFWARPPDEKELAADRYAAEQATRLRAAGLIPFEPRTSSDLADNWFAAS